VIMTRSVTVRVPAKINLQLAVGPLRPDGYHDLVTVFHAISLFDEVSVAVADAAPGLEGGDSRADTRSARRGDSVTVAGKARGRSRPTATTWRCARSARCATRSLAATRSPA